MRCCLHATLKAHLAFDVFVYGRPPDVASRQLHRAYNPRVPLVQFVQQLLLKLCRNSDAHATYEIALVHRKLTPSLKKGLELVVSDTTMPSCKNTIHDVFQNRVSCSLPSNVTAVERHRLETQHVETLVRRLLWRFVVRQGQPRKTVCVSVFG